MDGSGRPYLYCFPGVSVSEKDTLEVYGTSESFQKPFSQEAKHEQDA